MPSWSSDREYGADVTARRRTRSCTTPAAGLDVADCYALNVDGEAAWTSYYTDFPLVELRGDTVRSWDNTVHSAKAIAIQGNDVAFYGGYGDDADRLVLGRLADGFVQVDREYQVVRPDGGSMAGAEVFGRGPTLYFFAVPDWYRLDPLLS